MQALIFDQYGKPEDVLELRDIPEPEPGPGEVKVKMLYSPINPSDIINTIEGVYRDALGRAIWNHGKAESEYTVDPEGTRPLVSPPQTPGLEGVGVVVQAGAGLYPRFLLGKRVAVIGAARGNWQQYNVVRALQALPIRDGISDEQAAVSFVNPVTAYSMIHEVFGVKAGDVVLQSAGNSELGRMVIRLGKRSGFKTISIVRNRDQFPELEALGADEVIDSSTEDVVSRVCDITTGKGVKYALDPVAGELASTMTRCLGLNGKLLVYGTLSQHPLQFPSRDLMTPVASVEGFFLANWLSQQSLLQRLRITRSTAALVASSELASEIRAVYPLEDFQEAIRDVQSPSRRGKVLLRLNEP